MKKPVVLITETDFVRFQTITQCLHANGFDVISCPADGKDCVNQILFYQPCAVVLNIVMKNFGAKEVRQRVVAKALPENTPVFFATGFFCDDRLENDLSQNDFKYYFLKPFDETFLASQLNLFVNAVAPPVANDCIDQLLSRLHMPRKLVGYQYCKLAISLILGCTSYASLATKILYPEIAKQYNTTSSAVERSIRNAIEISFKQTSPVLLTNMFPKYKQSQKRATNLDFLLGCVAIIKTQAFKKYG